MEYRNPKPTVDVIVDRDGSIALIRRVNPPAGWALPGGFVDEGEGVEAAARREALEETGLVVHLDELLYVYSDPARDPRLHTISVVFTATAQGELRAGDDAAEARWVPVDGMAAWLSSGSATLDGLPIAFDHARILADYLRFRETGRRPRPEDSQG